MTSGTTPGRISGILALKLFIDSDLLMAGPIGKQKRYGW